MLKALRVSLLIPAAVAGAAILPLTGCDKTAGPGGRGSSSSAAANKPTVGVIDSDRVFTDVGWKGELARRLQVTQQDYTMALQAFVRDVDKAVADKKKEIAQKGRLNATQAGALERNEKLDQISAALTPELRQELYNTIQNRNYYVNQGTQYAGGMLRNRQAQLIGIYK